MIQYEIEIKQKAYELRRDQKLSYTQIGQKLGVGPSTVTQWFHVSDRRYRGEIRMGDRFSIGRSNPFVFAFDGKEIELRSHDRLSCEAQSPEVFRMSLEFLRFFGKRIAPNPCGSVVACSEVH